MARGGRRVGAGRKPKAAALALVHGSRDRGSRDTGDVAPVERRPVARPADLPSEQAKLWDEIAPLAMASGTLVADTALAFRDLVEAIVLKRAVLSRVEADGLVYIKTMVDGAGVEHEELKSHPLLSQFRGLMQRVETGMARFRLAPDGKERPSEASAKEPSALQKLQERAKRMRAVK